MTKQNIIPGSQQWEDICARCGLCCLVKCVDDLGRIWLTDIRCDMLDPKNGNCLCYSSDFEKRDNGCDSCAEHNGGILNYESLHNDYLVPGCCAYVQKFGDFNLVKKCAKRPDIDLRKTVAESSVAPEDIKSHIIPGSNKYFKYNPQVNKARHEYLKALIR